jgi:hypothetical protein
MTDDNEIIFAEIITDINTKLTGKNLKIQKVNEIEVTNVFLKTNKCAHSITGEDVNIVVKNKDNKIVGFLSLFVMTDCLYISFMCVSSTERNLGIGKLLGYISILACIKLKKRYVISIGVGSDIIEDKYKYHRAIIISQYILIKTFGFTDLNLEMNLDIRKKIFYDICKEDAETLFDTKNSDQMKKYIEYEKTLISDGNKRKSKQVKKRKSKQVKKRKSKKGKGKKSVRKAHKSVKKGKILLSFYNKWNERCQ